MPVTVCVHAPAASQTVLLGVPEAQLAVLLRWLGGASSAEIATELSLAGAEEATRLLRAAVATLRRAFVDRAGDDAER